MHNLGTLLEGDGRVDPLRRRQDWSSDMRLYAQTPMHRIRQVLADSTAILAMAVAVRLALAVRHAILLLAEPAKLAQSAGDDLAADIGDTGNAVSALPFVGEKLQKSLRSAADASTDISDAGYSIQHMMGHVANLMTLALIVFPVLLVLALWLPPRLRWIRRSSATRHLFRSPGGPDLLALRALVGRERDLVGPAARLGSVADAWRRKDPQAIDDLSQIALRQVGLRP